MTTDILSDDQYESIKHIHEVLSERIKRDGTNAVHDDLRSASRRLMHAMLRVFPTDTKIPRMLMLGFAIADQVRTSVGNDAQHEKALAELRRFCAHGINSYGQLAYNTLFRPNKHGEDDSLSAMLDIYWLHTASFGPGVLTDLLANLKLAGTAEFQDLTIEPVD